MKILSVLFILLLQPLLYAALTIYPDTPNAVVSSMFSLSINGTPVQVRDYMTYHYAHFAFDGTIQLTVTASETIHKFKISPLSLGLQGAVSGATLTFSMTQAPDTDCTPRYLVIKINNLEELVLLGDPLETDAPPASGPGIFNVVTDYGADNTGATQTQTQIQNAINAAGTYGSASQKGIVFVPAGLYKIHEDLRLRNYVDFYLAPGAVLKADEDKSHYNTSDSTIDPALTIQDVHDVVVRGRGELDASGLALMNPVGGQLTEQSPTHPRRRIILTLRAANLVIKDIIAKDGTGWSVEPRLSDNVLIQNVKVLNHADVWYKIQNDGINNVSNDDMVVNQCFVMTIDDAYCFKAQYTDDGAMVNGLYSNNVAWNWCAGVKCGMQNNHAMTNCVFRNIDIIQTRRAIGFDTKTSAPAVPIDGPVFIDIRCEELKGNFSNSSTYVTEFYTETADIRNITIRNLLCMATSPINFSGSFPVSNITFDNLVVSGKPILSEADITVSKGVPVTNLVFKSDPYVTLSGPAGGHGMNSFAATVAFTENVTGLELNDFVLINGSVSNLTGGPKIYSVTVTPSGSQTVSVSLPSGVAQDNESNGNHPSNLLEIPFDPPIADGDVPTVASGSLYLCLQADSLGLANGAAVTSWTDSANGYVFTGNASYNASYANGHSAVRFNGINNALVNQALIGGPSTANLTLFIVGNFTTAVNDSVSDFLVSGQYPDGTSGNRLRILKGKTDAKVDVACGAGSVSSDIIASDTNPHVFAIVSGRMGNAVDFLIDNAVVRSLNSGTNALALQALGLGCYHRSMDQFGDCSIAEVLLYDSALTSADTAIIYDYLKMKYFYDIPDAAYQAEDYTAQSDCAIESEHAGATGERNEYIDMGGINTWFEWNFVSGGTSGGRTTATFRYASTSSRPCEISLNAVPVGTLNFPSTGAWDVWSTVTMDLTLLPGLNTVRVTAATSAGGPNLDKMDIGQDIPSTTESMGTFLHYTGTGAIGYTFTSVTGQQLRISPSGDYIVRVQAVRPDEMFFSDQHYEMVADHAMGGSLTLTEFDNVFILQTSAADGIEIRLTKNPMRLSYYQKSSYALLAADAKGVSWNGTRTDVDFQLSDDHFFGAGHPTYGKLDSLDLTGKEVQRNYGEQAPLIVPFFMSHKGYGIFLNTTYQNRFRFAYNNEYSFGFDDQGHGGRMDYYFILGPRMTDMLDRYTQLTGRPRLPMKSIFGLHLSDKGSPNTSDEQWWKNRIIQHRAAGYPIDHICNDNRWRAGPGTWANGLFEWAIAEGRYPDPAEWAAWTRSNGLTMTLDLNRNTCSNSWGWNSSFNIPNSSCVSYNTAVPDYSSQAVRNWNWELFWRKSLDPNLNYPGDGLWMDEVDQMGCIPDSTITADGRTWAENENYYLFQIAKAVVQEGWDNENENSPPGIGDAKRPFVWSRGMTAGAQRYATHWTGDITSTYATMQQQIRSMQASGLSGFPYFNHDAGGFTPGPNDPMYRQWSMALGSFSPIWRPHGMGDDRWPLYRSAACQADASVYSRIRYELMPYVYTCAYQAYATGIPMARAMVIDYQDQPLAWSRDLQYMWGSQVLVAPNCSDGNNSVSVWLPDGNRWYDFWDKNVVYEPNQVLSYYAATGVLPLFVKEGSVIPKAIYSTSTFTIPKNILVLDVYTGSDGVFNLYEDDGVSEYFRTQDAHSITPIAYHDHCMMLTIGAAAGQYSGKPENRSYRLNYIGVSQSRPMGVDNVRLPQFTTEQDVLNNGCGYVFLPAEKRIFVVTQAIDINKSVTVGPVGSNPDINADGTVNLADFAAFVEEWLNGSCAMDNCWCSKADFNGDSFVDLMDFVEF